MDKISWRFYVTIDDLLRLLGKRYRCYWKTFKYLFMRRLYHVLMLLCFSVLSARSQNALTRQQMYEDFDMLTSRIKAISPHIAIKKALWKYDALKEMGRIRSKIDTARGTAAFELIVSEALNACQDYHTSLMDRPAALQEPYTKFHFYLPLAYVNGKYLLTRSITANNRTIPAGAWVKAVNSQKPDAFVASLTGELVMRYDLNRKKFYAENFWENQRTVQDGYIEITFEDSAKGIALVHFDTEKRLTFARPNRDTIRNQVDYWSEFKVLYIKLFRMDNALIPKLQSKIAAYRDGKRPIDKIIIDLRDNVGGNDVVWQTIFQALLEKPLSYPLILDGPHPNNLGADFLKDREIQKDSVISERRPFLRKFDFYQYTQHSSVLVPSDSSIRFKGKIVMIGNENIYSAGASAFVISHLAMGDRFYSVGRPTGRFLGVGYSPVIFKLPHSGIHYRIEPVVDATLSTGLVDLMHDRFEFDVPYTLEEIIRRDAFEGNTLGANYLIHFDPLTKKALDL
ncbi:hypothetical protein FPZ42_06795 [Mucilaginibacter achroorhodeus]|uniref:Tail specific protease domain-containing protein n=1 Tax=Mucilaginibacter achroorhodeus TaxID=2599294 RepID=A0A563U5Z7_9SPHI|nr:S41 family peptidase [Mucilaginibacter achroorhodeus]TWR26739.1 hypothetical protein FPZ42_06795 [Mucilaginibacter achroorhodeus]